MKTLEKFAILSLVVILICHHVLAQQNSAPRNIPQDTTITLRRLPGVFGGEDYGIIVSADGALTVERYKDLKLDSTIRDHVSREKVAQLIAEFEKVNFFSLKDRYEKAEDGCPVVGTDQPYAIVSFLMNGRKKAIAHYYGCGNMHAIGDVFPSQLFDLEKRIDEIIETEKRLK